MYGKVLEIENAVFPENIVFSQKNIVFFVGMTFSSVFEAPGTPGFMLEGWKYCELSRWILICQCQSLQSCSHKVARRR